MVRSFTLVMVLAALLRPTLVKGTLVLSDLQSIVGFPAACTAAYNNPISDCDGAHNSNGQLASCSSACITALNSAAESIDIACQGSKVDSHTLLGLFFDGGAVQFLCPNGATYSSTTTIPSSETRESASPSTSSSESDSQTTATVTETKTQPKSQSTLSTTSLSASTASTTSNDNLSHATAPTSTSRSVETTSLTSTVAESTKPFLTTAINDGVASTITSLPDRTGSSNPDSFGGGGSPFEVAGNAAVRRNAQETIVLLILTLCSTIFAFTAE